MGTLFPKEILPFDSVVAKQYAIIGERRRAIEFNRHLIPKTPKPFVLSLSKDKNLPSYARI